MHVVKWQDAFKCAENCYRGRYIVTITGAVIAATAAHTKCEQRHLIHVRIPQPIIKQAFIEATKSNQFL